MIGLKLYTVGHWIVPCNVGIFLVLNKGHNVKFIIHCKKGLT